MLQNVVPTILTLRLSREKFLISLGWNAAVAIDIAAAKLQAAAQGVCSLSDKLRLNAHKERVRAFYTSMAVENQ